MKTETPKAILLWIIIGFITLPFIGAILMYILSFFGLINFE